MCTKRAIMRPTTSVLALRSDLEECDLEGPVTSNLSPWVSEFKTTTMLGCDASR